MTKSYIGLKDGCEAEAPSAVVYKLRKISWWNADDQISQQSHTIKHLKSSHHHPILNGLCSGNHTNNQRQICFLASL